MFPQFQNLGSIKNRKKIRKLLLFPKKIEQVKYWLQEVNQALKVEITSENICSATRDK